MAEKRVIELEIQDNVKSLKTQYKEAIQEVQRLADTYGTTSKEAAEAAKRAAELKDRIEESKSLTDAFNPDAKFNALSSSIGGVLNGFQAYEGAMGLIGVESEQLQETLLKVQSAMALSQGIQGALEAKDAFMNLGAVVKNAFASMTTASKVFLAGGIGLVITGVALAVNEFNKYNEQLKESQKQQQLLADIEKEAIKNISAEASAADKLQKQLKDENLSRSEKTAKVKEFQKEYPNLLSNIDAEKSSINEINTALTQNIELLKLQSKAKAIQAKRAELYAQQLEIELGKEQAAEAARKTREENTYFGINFGAAYADVADATISSTEKKIQKALTLVDDFDASIQKQIDALQKRGAVVKQEGDKENKTAQEIANYTRQLEKERIDAMEDGMEKRIKLLQFELAGELSQIDKNGKKAGELKKAIEERYGKQIESVKKEYADRSDRDAEIRLEKLPIKRLEIGKQEIQVEGYVQSEITKIQEAEAAKRKEKLKERTDLILKYAKTFTDVYSSLNNLLNVSDNERLKHVKSGSKEEENIKRRMFKRDKALRISQTVVDTASNIVTSVRNGGGVPAGVPFGIAAGAMGALQLAAIARTKFDGGDSGSNGANAPDGAAGTNVNAPQFNTIGSSGINQLAQLQQQPVQAYVVSGQVTSAQALDRNRIQNSSL
ncbi:MAG: hypothetical protein EBS34_03360 [Flavobacteriales bacterium]|nr:hypothetical protein [Flavobacteriales bacterium]